MCNKGLSLYYSIFRKPWWNCFSLCKKEKVWILLRQKQLACVLMNSKWGRCKISLALCYGFHVSVFFSFILFTTLCIPALLCLICTLDFPLNYPTPVIFPLMSSSHLVLGLCKAVSCQAKLYLLFLFTSVVVTHCLYTIVINTRSTYTSSSDG